MPSGNVYDIKDAVARQAIAGGVSFIIAWNGTSTPVVADIPAGVTVTYNGTTYTGTLAAADAQPGAFYLVNSLSEPNNIYSEYVPVGAATKTWEKLGDTTVDISDLGALAYKDNVTLNKGNGGNVLGASTTFTAASSSVSFSGGTTDKVLGSDATFTTTVTPTTTNIKATASGAAVGADGTDTFVKSYPGTTSKLETTTVPNVTGNTDVSIPNVTGNTSVPFTDYSFTMGTGDDAETLIISGTSKSATNTTLGTNLSASKVTLGTAKTVATGSLTSGGSGASVMTGLGTATTASALTGVKVTAQPTVALATGATAGTGVISVATGITSASTTTNNKDEVTAVTSVGTGTAAAQTITVGSNDTPKVALYNDLSVTVS